MKQPWFWGTFCFLFVCASAVISWALISTPLQFNPQIISHVENDFNGQKQRTEFWVNGGLLSDLLPLIEKQWKEENWEPVGSGSDLTNAILGISSNDFDLSSEMQVKVYSKGDLYRVLGLLRSKDSEMTYGMTSDLPRQSLDPQEAQKKWNFPIQPPNNNCVVYSVHFRDMKIGLILSSNSTDILSSFLANAARADFTSRLLSQEKNKTTFLLSDQKIKIIVLFSQDRSQSFLSLVSVDHI